jgi:hypothetical protein
MSAREVKSRSEYSLNHRPDELISISISGGLYRFMRGGVQTSIRGYIYDENLTRVARAPKPGQVPRTQAQEPGSHVLPALEHHP